MFEHLPAPRSAPRARLLVLIGALAAATVACSGGASTAPTAMTTPPMATAASGLSSPTPAPIYCAPSGVIQPKSPADVIVNADGDGVPDRLTIFTQPGAPPSDGGSTPSGGSQQLQLVLDERGAFNIEAAPTTSQRVVPIGGYDVDDDGRDELFVATGSGAYTTWVDIFKLDPAACALARITNPDPHWMPPLFAVGASVGNGAGLQCRDETLVETTFSRISETPLRYGGKTTTYGLVDNHLEAVPSGTGEWSADTVPSSASSFDCGSLRLPP